MILIKVLLKLLVLPVLLLVLIAQWIGLFFTGIASVVLGILSTLFWGFALVGLLFGAITGHEAIEMMAVAFVVFIIPHICGWMINVLGTFRLVLGDFIRS